MNTSAPSRMRPRKKIRCVKPWQLQKQVEAANEVQRAEFEAKLMELEAKLREAKEKNQRALSMAQQTRSGHVYVISNIGSFGEEVFKIGMTRRLEPRDRSWVTPVCRLSSMCMP